MNEHKIRKSTGVKIISKAIKPGDNKRTIIAQNEEKVRLIAEQMKKGISVCSDIQSITAAAFLDSWRQKRGTTKGIQRKRTPCLQPTYSHQQTSTILHPYTSLVLLLLTAKHGLG